MYWYTYSTCCGKVVSKGLLSVACLRGYHGRDGEGSEPWENSPRTLLLLAQVKKSFSSTVIDFLFVLFVVLILERIRNSITYITHPWWACQSITSEQAKCRNLHPSLTKETKERKHAEAMQKQATQSLVHPRGFHLSANHRVI
jgi:hypothetical protein